MRAVDEPVAIYDARGQVIGVAPRGVVYRDGLWHASTGVLVRSGDGERVYLHQRSPEKLIFPRCYDCWAGGVLGPGESPDAAAARELDEELGVRGVPLTPIDRFPYDDGALRYHVFLYEVRWDGPLRHQPEEVVWGGWVTLQELRDVLTDPARPFAPDGKVAIERWFAVGRNGLEGTEGGNERACERINVTAPARSAGRAQRGRALSVQGAELSYGSATELVDAMAGGAVSAVELATEAIGRIERYDTSLNAVCVPDFERALEAARAADTARAQGDTRPLLGVPMTVKESFHVAGLPTTWGIPELKDFVPDADAVAVQRVKAAGAVVLGKTNVPLVLGDMQSYNAIYGTTRNPWDPQRTPGGSSGGSAAALAAGYGALSLGSDIGGSLRNPAHYCGIYAHKPTLGLLPLRGHTPPGLPVLPAESDLAVIGPMARTATDLALLLDLLAEPDELSTGIAYRLALPPARHDELAGHRVLVIDTHPLIPTASSVRAAIDGFAAGLVKAGATVERESPLLPDQAEAARVYMRLLLSVLGAQFPPEVYEHARSEAAGLDADDRSLGAERTRGTVLSHRDWIVADAFRAVLRQQWRELHAEFDVVVYPVMPTPAFPHDQSTMGSRRIGIDGADHDYLDQIALAGVATLPGLPATALPIGRSDEGLPIGVQAIGPMFGDRTTIRFAELAEREFGGFTPPPGY